MARTKKTTEKTKTPAKRGTRKQSRPAAQPPKTVPRPVWAVLYGCLGALVLLSLLPLEGFLLTGINHFFSGFIGSGVYVLPFALLGGAVLLLMRPKGPVRLRLFCLLLLPVDVGCLAHVFLAGDWGAADAIVLWDTGVAHSSGGVLSGALAAWLIAAVSRAGAALALTVLLAVLLMVACHITPAALWRLCKTPEYEYDSEEEAEKYEHAPNPMLEKAAEMRSKAAKRRRSRIDIPLDPEPPAVFDVEKPENALSPENPPAAQEPLKDLEELVRSATAGKPEEGEKLTEEEQEKLSHQMDESQRAPAPEYIHPSMALLKKGKKSGDSGAAAELRDHSSRLIDTLQSFNIDAQIINIVRGPSVTRYEITMSRGIKYSKLTSLSDDIALALGAANVRIAPIPDKLAIGIEVPNKAVQTVFLRDVLDTQAFRSAKSRLAFAVGKDITGSAIVADIAKMPHMLIAGTTGSGKSICINAMLISLLYQSSPEEVRLIMVDPKMVELGMYNGIPHLLIPVVTDPQKAAGALKWAVGEMMRRYKLFAEAGVKKIEEYNEQAKRKQDGGEAAPPLPQIVIVIDELADLMMVAANEVEDAICRIAQLARAAGMHLVIATQRPSADVITGIMKANIPSRVAFAVASQVESRIILDQTGAEKLIGKGDMLFHPLGTAKPIRIQGCFVSNEEVEDVIEFIKRTSRADYSQEVLDSIEKAAEARPGSGAGPGGDEEDSLLPEAIEIVVHSGQASVSMLQRRLKLGYARAARLVDQMEERGIVGPYEGSKPRQVLISKEDWQEMRLRQME